METELESRLSVAGHALFAVQQMNAGEKSHFLTMCNQQRQKLSSLVSWEFRHVSLFHHCFRLYLESIQLYHTINIKNFNWSHALFENHLSFSDQSTSLYIKS